jgi:glycosyltransferase involved in cell wall biosynthesis
MDFVVVATADWDNPLWTNKQQLSSRWGAAGHRVLYVESLGLRRPAVSGRDIGRMWRRLRRANRFRPAASGVWVFSPLVIPLHDSAFVRRLNRRILSSRLRRAMRRMSMTDSVLWTYNPLVLDQLGGMEWGGIVYHCVDELAGSPGIPSALIERAEAELCRAADLVIVSAPGLAEGPRAGAQRLEYVPNAADFELFHRAAGGAATPEDLARITGPRIGFFGAISDYKLDLELLDAVFRSHPEWQLVFVGPIGEGDPDTRVASLAALPNVHFLGSRHREELPGYLGGFDVCLLPNRLNRYTRHMFPLKFFEYLAAGKPVVMTPLPSLEAFCHLAHVAEAEPEAFSRSIADALKESPEDAVRGHRIDEARRHDWNTQARKLAAMAVEAIDDMAGSPEESA